MGRRLEGMSSAQVIQAAAAKWEAMQAAAPPAPAVTAAHMGMMVMPQPPGMGAPLCPHVATIAPAASPLHTGEPTQGNSTMAPAAPPVVTRSPDMSAATIEHAPDGRPFLSSPAGTRYLKRKASGGADDYRIQKCPDGRQFLRSPSSHAQAWLEDVLDGGHGSWPAAVPKAPAAPASSSTGHVALVEHQGQAFTLNLGMGPAQGIPAPALGVPVPMALGISAMGVPVTTALGNTATTVPALAAPQRATDITLTPWHPTHFVAGLVQGVATPGVPSMSAPVAVASVPAAGRVAILGVPSMSGPMTVASVPAAGHVAIPVVPSMSPPLAVAIVPAPQSGRVQLQALMGPWASGGVGSLSPSGPVHDAPADGTGLVGGGAVVGAAAGLEVPLAMAALPEVEALPAAVPAIVEVPMEVEVELVEEEEADETEVAEPEVAEPAE